MLEPSEMEIAKRLGLALALGLLIGVERGWAGRSAQEGTRIAGLRTFGLIGLLGGLWALLAQHLGPLVLGFAFLGFAAVVIAGHWLETRETRDYGITTVVAALVAFALGALALYGHSTQAAAAAVAVAVLLRFKPQLHGWLSRLEPGELHAALRLLVISVILLPVLPNQGYGPWEALNPYEIWWMVVLIAGISFVGYFAIKIAGPQRGVILTAMSGGLVSSTPLTLSFSRMGQREPALQGLLAVGVVLASSTVFPRILIVVGVVAPSMVVYLAWPFGIMMLAGYGAALWQWRRVRGEVPLGAVKLHNPSELGTALQFGALLALVMLLAHALQAWLGHAGIYLLAAVSGITDVDAITLSLSRLVPHTLALQVAAQGIVLAAMMNTLVKGALVFAIAGRRMGWQVGLPFGLVILGGIVGLVIARQLLPLA